MSLSEKEETKKLYHSISEVSEMYDIPASTIRYWEKEFDFLKPNKNQKGNRVFTEKDLENIAILVDLVKLKGYTIAGAKEQIKNQKTSKLKLTENGENKTQEVIAKLQEIRTKLINLSEQLDSDEDN